MSAFTWMLLVKVLPTEATGGYYMNEPSAADYHP